MDKDTYDAIIQAIAYLATTAIAACAGVLKYLQQFQAPGGAWSWRVFVIQVLTAILAGKIAEWLFTGWKADHNLVYAAVALAGWGGAQAIALAGRKIAGEKEPQEGQDAAH